MKLIFVLPTINITDVILVVQQGIEINSLTFLKLCWCSQELKQ